MKSRTSSFNSAIYKKNLTRFAPLWCLYLLCLILGMMMMYMDSGADFWYASRMGECIQIMGAVNLVYAPVVAMLLFGDLYNSRMCNAIHAMPVRRETLFATNVLSGLTFSLIPTAIMTLLSIPLLMNTCVVDAWQIGLLWFLGTNLEFICFFGIAVFSVFCVGNRFTMALVYTALNAGAYLVRWIIDTLYTPLLYGVVTPSALAELLTPVANMVDNTFVEVEEYAPLLDLYETTGTPIVAEFWCNPEWWYLIAYAAVGVVFLAAALVLYRRRRLECAGDAMASKKLEPVFQICFTIAAAAFTNMICEIFFATNGSYVFLFLAFGLLVGWFAARMLIERTVRVFRLKNWLGLLAMISAVAVSFGLTLWDPLGIETWTPQVDQVKAASIDVRGSYQAVELTNPEDIANLIRLQEMALEDRLEYSGDYPVINGELSPQVELWSMTSEERSRVECRYASTLWLEYEMESGKTVKRRYFIWGDGPEREIVTKYLSSWEALTTRWAEDGLAAPELDQIERFSIEGEPVPEEYWTREMAEALLEAVKADCEAGRMVQSRAFHDGHFTRMDEEETEVITSYIYVSIRGKDSVESINFCVYADCENTLNWLREYDLLTWEVSPKNVWGG